jgi:polysaccharide biosynthesis protein PslJ
MAATVGPAAGPAAGSPSGGVSARRRELALWAFVGLALVASLGAAQKGVNPGLVLAVFVLPLVIVAGQRVLLAWPTLLGAILVVILFIPIRRYTIGSGGPVAIEPYRVLIAVVLGCWFLALAADPKVRWHPTGWGAPVFALWLTILASLALNLGRVNAVGSLVLKQLSFFLSYFLVMCFISSILRRGASLDRMLRLLVGGGTVVAFLALVEWRTGTNIFNSLHILFPFLTYHDVGEGMVRGSGVRALASAQHPIALGAALVMLLPLCVYLNKRSGRPWWLACAGLLTLGALSTGSRTAAVMLIVTFVCFLWLKRKETIRMLPQLLVLVCCVQAVMPGTIGSFKAILNPNYVVKEQSYEGGTGSGRLADIGPAMGELSAGNPFVGLGFGTRITSQSDGDVGGAQILDDQWLGTLLEIGFAGAATLMWLFVRAIRRLAAVARSDTGADGWLATTLATSLTAFVVGMFTFDAFAFIQVTFFAFTMLGFAAVAVRRDAPAKSARALAGVRA